MEAFLFIYTILIIILSISASTMSLSYFLISRNKVSFYIVFIFLFYALDFSVILFSNSFEASIAENIKTFYEVSYPAARIIFGGGFLGAIWLTISSYFRLNKKLAYVLPLLSYFLCYLLFFFYKNNPISQWLFYLPRQIFLIFCSIYCVFKFQIETDKKKRLVLSKFKIFPIVTIVFSVLIILEDTVNILIIPADFFFGSQISSNYANYISERNFCENILMVFYAMFCIVYTQKNLNMMYQLAPHVSQENIVLEYIDTALPEFALRYDLTKREEEILSLVLKDFDNKQIANEYYLAVGTVKAHLHNIFKKTNVENREDLIKLFWR